jgi:hypothetical protein
MVINNLQQENIPYFKDIDTGKWEQVPAHEIITCKSRKNRRLIMEDVERFESNLSKKIMSKEELEECSRNEIIEVENDLKYGFFISLNMENFKATKNWRKFCGKCIMENCFIFERICYNKKDKSYITNFKNLLNNTIENFLSQNTEFLIFCGEKSVNRLCECAEKNVIERDLNILAFDFSELRDLSLKEGIE